MPMVYVFPVVSSVMLFIPFAISLQAAAALLAASAAVLAAVAFVFAALVNFAMYYKLKRVEMVESLKSVD